MIILDHPLYHASSHLLCSSHKVLWTFSSLNTLSQGFCAPSFCLTYYVSFLIPYCLLIPFISSSLVPSSSSGICANITSSKKPFLSTQSREFYPDRQPSSILSFTFVLFIVLPVFKFIVFIQLFTCSPSITCQDASSIRIGTVSVLPITYVPSTLNSAWYTVGAL